MNTQKRILAVHDISCVGKCSLTVALPIISAAGIETSVLPTAVLSTHTGGFTGYTYRDLTEDIRPIEDHWETLGLSFDAIYTGFLGSFEQVEIVSELFDRFKTKDNLILVDPVMADNGELYSVFTPDFPLEMRKLCAKADVIIPNMTEAHLMLKKPYKDGPYTKEYIESLLRELAQIGAPKIVLTGVYFDDKTLGAACFDKEAGKISYAMTPKIEGSYHGTGDVFGSALLSALLNGKDISAASQVAADFTAGSIQRTKDAKTDIRYGVNFEAGIPSLLKALDII